MTLIEFIKHPAYQYYITTLVHDFLLSDLNKRKSSIFKDPDGSIHDIDAFSKKTCWYLSF